MALVGTEILYVNPVAANGSPAATLLQTTTADIAALAEASQIPPVKNTAITTVGNGTLTAAAIVGGVITRSGPSADFSDATDTAVAIVAALAAYVANESSVLRIKNTTLFTQTVTAGVGVTLTGTAVIPENTIASYLVTITSPTAVTLLYLGSAFLANSLGAVGDIMLGNGLALKTDTTTAHTAVLQAYDVDGTAYKTFATLTNGNTPSLAIAAPSGGTVAINGATLGGTAANTLAAGNINQDIAKCSSTLTSSDTTLTSITGLSFTVVPGTYKFRLVLQGVADGTGGIKCAFKYTTTVVSSLQATAIGSTASAIATQSTTTATDQALLFDQAAAVLQIIVEGSMVVGTGGTIAVQAAQHAANASSTVVVGSTAQFTRIA